MKIIKKGTKLYSVVHLKCPRCQEGNLFLCSNPYKLKQFDKMPDHCAKCDLDLKRENGYYWGAMMISHAFTTVFGVIVHALFIYFYGWESMALSLVFFILFILLLLPVTFRLSRAIWINIFVDYNPDAIKYHNLHDKTKGIN